MDPQADPLSALRDIHLPPEPGWLPPAPGWWAVAIFAAIVGWRLVLWLRARHRRRLPARAALNRLSSLRARHRQGEAGPVLVAELATVLRRAALSRFPRERVGGLAGRDWLEFLRDTSGDPAFVDGPGQALASAPYRAHPTSIELEPMLDLAEAWVRKNAG